MASPHSHGGNGKLTVSTWTKSPRSGGAEGEAVSNSPKGMQCLCSPTTHQGSFRCRFHRTKGSAWLKRSSSMPTNANKTPIDHSASPKSVDSSTT
ncbi:Peroxiredoxins prx-1 prx-2 prx-3 [Quillaja saponaria]|uniref:Peroxiredoxins prx-1 prx-2 prx-3 n=1 Tax=Quillaja saponaria TaxID=32244 RepID=A0AAD7M452_QUISA|nr:Peroxiredoxins prx-1 prx-2 prx-3 [Quillaja saponaria]